MSDQDQRRMETKRKIEVGRSQLPTDDVSFDLLRENLVKLIKQADKAANLIKPYSDTIRVFGQYDADGITATSIFVKALLREGKSIHTTILKQLTAINLELVKSSKESFVVLIDFGSGQLEFLNQLKAKTIIIIDHHQPQGQPAENIIHINPLDFEITENISSSGISYIVSRALDKNNKDLAELAIIGAIGDSQMGSIGSEWGLLGLNKEIVKDAVASKKINHLKGLRIWGRLSRPLHKALEYSIDPYIPNVSGSESGAVHFLQELGIPVQKDDGSWRTLSDLTQEEQQKLASGIIIERATGNQENPDWIFGDVYELVERDPDFRDAAEFATMINATGKLEKAYLGLAICLGDPNYYKKVKDLYSEYRKTIGSYLRWIEKNKDKAVRETDNAVYVLAGDKISEHIISNVISIMHKDKYNKKPLFGLVSSEEGLKISARISDSLADSGVNLKEILSTIAPNLGGQGGGHKAASGATIPAGKEEEFIEKVDAILCNIIQKNTTESNINTKEEVVESGAIAVQVTNGKTESDVVTFHSVYGQTGHKEIGTEGEGKRGEAAVEDRNAGKTEQGRRFEKMERKGLVRYLVS